MVTSLAGVLWVLVGSSASLSGRPVRQDDPCRSIAHPLHPLAAFAREMWVMLVGACGFLRSQRAGFACLVPCSHSCRVSLTGVLVAATHGSNQRLPALQVCCGSWGHRPAMWGWTILQAPHSLCSCW